MKEVFRIVFLFVQEKLLQLDSCRAQFAILVLRALVGELKVLNNSSAARDWCYLSPCIDKTKLYFWLLFWICVLTHLFLGGVAMFLLFRRLL